MKDRSCNTCKLKPVGAIDCGNFTRCFNSFNSVGDTYTLWVEDPLYADLLIDRNAPILYDTGEPPKVNPFDKQVGGNHYKKEGVPDVTEWCMLHGIDLAEFNVIKYVFRHEKKNGMEDLRKAQHYLEFIAWIKYGENL